MKSARAPALALVTGVALVGCGSTDSIEDRVSSAFATAFPRGVAVASPLDVTEAPNPGPAALRTGVRAPASVVSSHASATQTIDALLDGTLSVSRSFDPEHFRSQAGTAGCFGPTLLYENHPDGTTPNSGQLPSGDLGLWVDTDSFTGHACAAAQLNARMNGISEHTQAALTGLASLLAVADAAGLTAPGAGESLDLVSQMNAAGVADTTFSTATVALDADGSVWSYTLAFSYAPGTVDYPSGVSGLDMRVSLRHAPGADENAYKGLVTWQVEDVMNGGNCPKVDNADATNPVTLIGSLLYEREGADDLNTQLKSGQFCGHDLAAGTGLDADGLADGGDTYQMGTNDDGWGNGFVVFGADYDPTTLEGEYTFAWQAGPMDSHSRIFNVGINYHDTEQRIDGEAYFGYGARVATTDGTIQGMICNWAGPGNDHTLVERAQRQFVSYDADTEKFTVSTGGSDIVYAPTVACTYDTAGSGGSFLYDRDLDNTLSDESAATVDVTDPAGAGLAFDLFPASTSAYAGMDVEDAIDARGYDVPVPPTPSVP